MINSILDNDLYKFTMHYGVHECYQNIPVVYQFTNRDPSMRYNKKAFGELRKRILRLADLKLQSDEEDFLHERCPFLPEFYISYLKQFRYHPECVKLEMDADGQLYLQIKGLWDHTILFEVPLLAMISEVYFELVDTDWEWDENSYLANVRAKGDILERNGCKTACFSTRRRRLYESQDAVVRGLKPLTIFMGTSNVHLAHKHDLKPIGTQAHEWIMGTSAICGLRHANRYALENWIKVFDADLGIALTDTYGTDAFFNDFDMRLSKLFDGVRHDSGDPIEFTDKVIKHYKKHRMDPTTKSIIYSDGLNVEEAIRIQRYREGEIRKGYGIGTNLSNDFRQKSHPLQKSKPMNIVIKLRKCNSIPVVKLSDAPSKATGDKDALRVADWTFFGTSLDEGI